jgi:tetratricopeptide (TPR) repeat protein
LFVRRRRSPTLSQRHRHEYAADLPHGHPDRQITLIRAIPATTLLAYDLYELSGSKNVQMLCTLDTLEYIEKPGQERGSLPDLLSRLVYLMPNVAFLSGSRRRSTWADEAGRISLTYGGAEFWPDLVEGGRGQFRISGLADDYAHQLLIESLDLNGKPAIPEHIRQQIVHGAAGLPLHLELSVNWYYDAASRGIDDLSHRVARSFPELVRRIMRDLSPVECDLLRAACLVEAFDEALLADVVPEARRSEIDMFLSRPMIDRTPLSWLPYSLHDSLREAIVEQDRFTDRSWTEEEWRDHATRSTAWLAHQVLPAWDAGHAGAFAEEAGRQVVAAMLLSANAAVRHGIQPENLGELAFLTSELGFEAAFLSITDGRISSDSPSLIRLVAAARVHANKELDHVNRYQMLRSLVLFDPTDGYDHFIAAIFGRAADVEGTYDEAQRAYRSIQSSQSFMDSFGKLGVAGSALRSGHLRTALSSVVQVADHPLQVAFRLDLLGHIHIQGGEHEKGAHYFEQALSAARESGSPLWVARALRHVAHARMWFDPEGTLDLMQEATEINLSLNEYTGLAQLEQATALAYAWRQDWAAAEEALAACNARSLDPVSVGHPTMVEMLLSVGQGDRERAQRVADIALADPRARRSPGRRPHVWLAVIALWANRPDVNTFKQIEWYDSSTAARRRFSEVWDRAAALADGYGNG